MPRVTQSGDRKPAYCTINRLLERWRRPRRGGNATRPGSQGAASPPPANPLPDGARRPVLPSSSRLVPTACPSYTVPASSIPSTTCATCPPRPCRKWRSPVAPTPASRPPSTCCANQKRPAFSSRTPGAPSTSTISVAPVKAPEPLAFPVDLPGYGYACVSGTAVPLAGPAERLRADAHAARRPGADDGRPPPVHRPRLPDGRVVPAHGRPIHVLLTKADKLTNSENAPALRETRRMLAEYAAQLEQPVPLTAQLFSSLKRRGIEEAQRVVAGWLGLPEAQAADAPRRSPRPRRGRRRAAGALSATARGQKPRCMQRGGTFPPRRATGTRSGRSSGDTAPRMAQRRVSASMIAGTPESLVFLDFLFHGTAGRRQHAHAAAPAGRPAHHSADSVHVHLPEYRPRRMRRDDFSRRMMREHRLTPTT